MNKKLIPPLTAEEQKILKEKKDEDPFSGEYWHSSESGRYLCRRCGTFLFSSKAKFNSFMGWPSFDDAEEDALILRNDKSGYTEICCRSCDLHLGRVIFGEDFTTKNTRYCVNSMALYFEAEPTAEAYLSGGSFWTLQAQLKQLKGVLETTCGYTGGDIPHPTYEQVCSAYGNHAEAVEIIFNPEIISYEKLLRHFFEIHDPCLNKGPDGSKSQQFRSSIFYTNEEQRKTSEKIIEILKQKGWKIITTLEPLLVFYPAEDYHQDYLKRKGPEVSCFPTKIKRFDRSPEDF